jgi:hypothetical protein
VENIPNKDIPVMVASRIEKKLKERLADLGNKVQFSIRIRILLCDRGYANIDKILQHVKTMRSLRQSQGGATFEYYDRTSLGG